MALALPASAATGLQYDEIMKMYFDGTTPDVGTFTPDYTKLAARPPQPQGQGGPGGFAQMMMRGGNPMAMFSDGFLTRHAYLGQWVRTDDPNTQTARITKCDSGQIISLNLANKTYRIIDPSAPAPSGRGSGGAPGERSAPEMDPGKTKITMKTTALGPKTLDGTATDGYQMSTQITSERDGRTTNVQFDGTSYFTSLIEPRTTCAVGMGLNLAGPMAGLARAASMIGQMTNSDRFKIEVSGPTPPYSHLPLYQVQKMSGENGGGPGGRGGAPVFLIERGNVKTLTDADKALFEIPAGFTKES